LKKFLERLEVKDFYKKHPTPPLYPTGVIVSFYGQIFVWIYKTIPTTKIMPYGANITY
jgi:hypothetical protein